MGWIRQRQGPADLPQPLRSCPLRTENRCRLGLLVDRAHGHYLARWLSYAADAI